MYDIVRNYPPQTLKDRLPEPAAQAALDRIKELYDSDPASVTFRLPKADYKGISDSIEGRLRSMEEPFTGNFFHFNRSQIILLYTTAPMRQFSFRIINKNGKYGLFFNLTSKEELDLAKKVYRTILEEST